MHHVGTIALVCGLGLVTSSEVLASTPARSGGTQANAASLRASGGRRALEHPTEKTADGQPKLKALGASVRAATRAALRLPKVSTEAAAPPELRPVSSAQRSALASPESSDTDVSLHEQTTLTGHQIDERYPIPPPSVFETAKTRIDPGAASPHDVEKANAAIATTRSGLETLRSELRTKLAQGKARGPWKPGLSPRERAEIHFTLAHTHEQLSRVAEAQGASGTAGALMTQAAQEFESGAKALQERKGSPLADETRAIRNALTASTRLTQRAAHHALPADAVVRNAKDVVADVDRVAGSPGVEVFLWSAKGQPFGHAGVAARLPGEDKLRVFDVTGNKDGELVVREFESREDYLYGAHSSNATQREVYSARLTDLSPTEHAEVGNIATTFRALAARSQAGSAHYRLFLGEGHPVLQRMLVPLEKRVIPLQEGFASKGELGNCARCTSRALTAGGVAPPGREAMTPVQLFNRFVKHHMDQDPSRLQVVDWKQTGGAPSQPREHVKQGSVPAPSFVVEIDARTRTANVAKAGPDYRRIYKSRKGRVVEP